MSNRASCDICNEEMPQGSISNHRKRHQENIKKKNGFKCNKCNYETNLKTNLTRHSKTCGQVKEKKISNPAKRE